MKLFIFFQQTTVAVDCTPPHQQKLRFTSMVYTHHTLDDIKQACTIHPGPFNDLSFLVSELICHLSILKLNGMAALGFQFIFSRTKVQMHMIGYVHLIKLCKCPNTFQCHKLTIDARLRIYVCVPSQTQGVQWYGGSPSHRSCVASAFHAPRRCASATSW